MAENNNNIFLKIMVKGASVDCKDCTIVHELATSTEDIAMFMGVALDRVQKLGFMFNTHKVYTMCMDGYAKVKLIKNYTTIFKTEAVGNIPNICVQLKKA